MRKPSIRKKIIFYTVIPVTLLYNLLSGLDIFLTFKESTSEIKAQMQNNVVQFARLIDMQAMHIESLGKAQASLLMSNPDQAFPILKDMVASTQYLHSALLFNKNTHFSICTMQSNDEVVTCPQFDQAVLNDYGGFQRSDEPHWVPRQVDYYSDTGLVSFILPISNGSGWQLTMNININKLIHSVINPKLFDGHYVGINFWKFNLVDYQGDYIYTDSRQAKKYGHTNLRETGVVYGVRGYGENVSALIDAGEPNNSRIWIPNPLYQRAYWIFGAPVGSVKWWLYTSVAQKDAMAEIWNKVIKSVSLMLVLLLSIFLGIWRSTSKITKPLISLQEGMDQFIRFNRLKELPDIQTHDEIGSLSHSFIKLVHWLSARDRALHQARASNMGHIVQELRGNYFYFQLNSRGHIIYISPSVESVLGYRMSDFSESFDQYLCSRSDRETFRTKLKQAVTGEKLQAFELNILHRNRSQRKLEIFWTQMNSGQPQPLLEGLANDVTERVNDTLKFKALLDSGPDAMIILNTDGIIAMVNSPAVELLGLSRENLVNMPLSIIAPPDSREEHPLIHPLRDRAWEDTKLFRVETEAYNPSGKTFPAELTSSPLITHDGILISVVIRDISKRKQIETSLQTALDQAVLANRSKSMFLSCMSHELRTPLNGIIGYAQILKRMENVPPAQYQKLDTMEHCGHHLLNLINDILDLSRIESQGVTLHDLPVNLWQTLEETINLLQQKADDKNLTLSLELCREVPQWVRLDETKCRQVLINLIGNAIKFTHKGYVRLRVHTHEERLHFAVIDTGVGISPDKQGIIFEPFRQLKEDSKAGGAGLGLAICRQLVSAMGGELQLDSTVDQGSQFFFSMPLVLSEPLATDSRNSVSSSDLTLMNSEDYVVLIVDDVEVNQSLLRDIMESAGFQTRLASDGQEALDSMKNSMPDLVMMDIRMPRMDGMEAINHIRSDPQLQSSIVIAITASVGANNQHKLTRAGFNATLEKPFDINHLFQTISELLNLPIQTRTTSSASSLSSRLPSLSQPFKQTLQQQLSDILDLGDLGALSDVARQITQKELSPYREYFLHIAETYDIDELERFSQKLINL